MMSGKNKMPLNIIIDFVMLMAMALVSISGFILEIVIPSRHAVRFQDATPWCSHLLGLEGMIGVIFICGRELYWSLCLPFISCYT